MKVKEVENFNTIFQMDGEVSSSPDNIVNTYLKTEGKVLCVGVASEISPDHIRRMSVSFMSIDFDGKLFEPVPLITANITDFNDILEVPLDKVMTVPTNYPQTFKQLELSVEPLTYQANIEKSWGLETLTYPHRLHTSENLTLPTSTDGWYRLSVLDVPIWNGSEEYREGDVVYYVATESYYKAKTSTRLEPNNPDEEWSPMTDEDWLFYNLSMNRLPQNDATLRILSDLLVTRNVKYNYIFNCIKATSFSPGDNPAAEAALSRIIALREVSVAYLEVGDPIKAVAAIQSIPAEYDALFNSDSTNELKTEFTL